ncbi:MAG: hypothetical protein M3Z95_07505 [Actinomycetota bacterium]|nr:hypothetical protein [Actinomycetota bacterium]
MRPSPARPGSPIAIGRRALAPLALALAGALCWAMAYSASAPGLIVIPTPASGPPLSYFKLTLGHGRAAPAGTIELRNPSARRLRVVLAAVDGQTINTLGSTYAPGDSHAHRSARWLRLGLGAAAGHGVVTIAAHQSAIVAISVAVPATAPPGDYLAGVSVEALDQKSQSATRHGVSIASVVRYAIGVEVSIPGRRKSAIGFTGAQLQRQPAGLTFLLDARNRGNVILQNVQGGALITSGRRLVARVALGPGTFVTATSIAYPILTPHEKPPQGTVYRVRAYLRYAGGIARLDTLVRFGRADALRQQAYGGPKAPGAGSSGLSTALVVALAALAGVLLILIALLLRQRRSGARSPVRTLDAALKRTRESGEPLSLIVVKVLSGGTTLRELAPLLRSRLRHIDRLCRLDGEGLLVVAPATDVHTAEVLAADLRRHLERACEGARGVTVGVRPVNGDANGADLLRRIRAANGGVHASTQRD